MSERKFRIIEYEKPMCANLFGHQRMVKGEFEGQIFYLWESDNDEIKQTDFSEFKDFIVTEPITLSTSSIQKNYKLVKSNHILDLYTLSMNSSGYAKPLYSYISNQFIDRPQHSKDYSAVLELFDLLEEDLITPDKFNTICNYKQHLLNQIKRQSDIVYKINKTLASILKVYVYGLSTFADIQDEKRAFLYQKIKRLFFFDILGGSSHYNVNLNWLLVDTNHQDLTHISKTSFNGISYLLRERDLFLEVSLNILDVLQPIEVLVESKIMQDRLITPKEYRAKEMISPKFVATEMVKNAKNPKYPVETIALAMAVVKEYLVENDLYSIHRKHSLLARTIKESNIPGIDDTTDIKTIKNWVVTYARKAGLTT